MRYALLFSTVGILALGQLLFKYAARGAHHSAWSFLLDPAFFLGLVLYAGATLSWMFVLRAFPITVAYPATALAIVLVLVAGVFLFGETINGMQALGIAAILAGLGFLALA